MTNEKYQCLVDAVAESGVTLPPLKKGSEVAEVADPRLTTPPLDPPPPGALAVFEYKAENGSKVHLNAHDIPANEGNPSKGWYLSEGAHNFVSTQRWQDSGYEPEVSSGFEKPKNGTAEPVAAKLFKCRSLLTS